MENKNKIFIPTTIRVGFQKRNDTYTGQLAYVIYLDAKGKVRKETSWQAWRDQAIEFQDFENVPTSGFVLNKKAGDYSSDWNHRKAYSRIYDPRNFEFEITVDNLLYILENTNSIKGKGLEGEFVYGWHGSDLILVPVEAPDYAEIETYTQAIAQPIRLKTKDLILGATYVSRAWPALVYLGQHEAFDKYDDYPNRVSGGVKHVFEKVDAISAYDRYKITTSLSSIIGVVDETPVSDYAERIDLLHRQQVFSPFSHFDYTPITREAILEQLAAKKSYWKEDDFFMDVNGAWLTIHITLDSLDSEDQRVRFREGWGQYGHRQTINLPSLTVQAFLDHHALNFFERHTILANGREQE